MLTRSVIQGLTCSSLIVSSFIAIVGQLAMAQSPVNHAQIVMNIVIQVAQTPSVIDEKAAVNLVWKLPQVKRKAKEIEQLSQGTIRVAALIASSPTPEAPYYTIRVVENHVDHLDIIYLFQVLNPSGVIKVYDILKDEYVSLEAWKPN